MGLKNDQKPTYVNLADGKFYESTDKEKTKPYGSLEGYITGMSFRDDTFENSKIRKCVISVNDGSDNYVLSVRVNSTYFGALISFLKNADLSKVVTLKPGIKEDKVTGKSIGTIFVQQEGQWLKAFYTKDKPNGLPPFKKAKLNGNVVWDKTAYLEFLENVVNEELKPQLNDKSYSKPSGLKVVPSTEDSLVDASEDVDGGDLPF